MENPVVVTALLLTSFYIAANKQYLTNRYNRPIPSARPIYWLKFLFQWGCFLLKRGVGPKKFGSAKFYFIVPETAKLCCFEHDNPTFAFVA